MPPVEGESTLAPGTAVWRDLAQLGAEALAIGIVFSLILALAVLVVARDAPAGNFAAGGTTAPPAATTL